MIFRISMPFVRAPQSAVSYVRRLAGRLAASWQASPQGKLAEYDTSQHGECAAMRALLPSHAPHFLVEVGAHDGLYLSNSLPFIREGWKAILMEPHPLLFSKLQERYAATKSVQCIPKACAEAPGVRPLFIGANGNLALNTLCTEQTAWFMESRSDDSIPVEVDTLTSILEQQQCPAEFGMLLIDAEGMDYEVLLGWDESRFSPHLLVTEEYQSNPQKHAAKYQLLQSKGYTLELTVGCNTIWRKRG